MNRQFETLESQDALFRYAGYENGEFFIERCTDAEVAARALDEISHIL